MKKILCLLFVLFSFSLFSQEPDHGTIKVEKKGNVYAVFFDNVNNRLVGKDNYGNILDSAVVSYTVKVSIQGVAYAEDVVGTTLSPLMQQRITRVDSGTTLFFSNIKVKVKKSKVIDWPKFSAKIGYNYERQEN